MSGTRKAVCEKTANPMQTVNCFSNSYKEEQIALFRGAGRRAGAYFAKTYLDLNQDMDAFVGQLQRKLVEMKIGVLRIESIDDATGRIHLTVAEDAD